MGEQKLRYTPEFRADAMDLVRRGSRTLRKVVNALGVNHWTPREWCRQDAMKRSKTSTPPTASTANATETRNVSMSLRQFLFQFSRVPAAG